MAERRRIRSTSDRPQPSVNDYDRESMLRWLQWNDPNGCYTDDVALHERRPCLTHQEARALYEEAVADLSEEDFEPRRPAKTREEEAAEAQRRVADALNRMGLDAGLFARAYMSEHRTGQQAFARVAWAFFVELARQEHGDLRNEAARALARSIVGHVEVVNVERELQRLGSIDALPFI